MASFNPTGAPAENLRAAPLARAEESRHRAKNPWLTNPALRDAQPPLDEYYNSLFAALGPQHWWPGKTRFEIILGAILTQNTSWSNVESALAKLRAAGLFSPAAIEKVPLRRLERLIRSSGYYRQKARKL